MENWFLLLTLFFPRLTLLFTWLAGGIPANSTPFFADYRHLVRSELPHRAVGLGEPARPPRLGRDPRGRRDRAAHPRVQLPEPRPRPAGQEELAFSSLRLLPTWSKPNYQAVSPTSAGVQDGWLQSS